MQRDHIIADFGGGLSMSASVDKTADRELLVADNARFDELGAVAVTGASTKQNSSAYSDSGTTTIHSLYVNPTVRHIALVGNDVFAGSALSGLASVLDEVNVSSVKTKFAELNGQAFFSASGTPYLVDNNGEDHTVNWVVPQPSVTTTAASSGTQASVATAYANAWSNASNAASSNDSYATATVGAAAGSDYLKCTNFFGALAGTVSGIKVEVECKQGSANSAVIIRARLVIGGVASGQWRTLVQTGTFTTSLAASDTYMDTGGSTTLWGLTPTVAQLNATDFGVQLQISNASGSSASISVDHVRVTAYTYSAAFSVARGAAGVLNATYTYKITFEDIYGRESDASSASASVSPATEKVDITSIPTGDSKTVARNIYRKGGTLNFYYWVAAIADNSATSYTDNIADTTVLSTGILLAGEIEGDEANTAIGATRVVNHPAFYFDRLFWVETTADTALSNRIIWSKPSHPFAYPDSFYFDVGDASPVTAIVPFLDDLIVFKKDSIWRLSGKREAVFELVKTPASVGCDMPFTVTKLQDRIIFCNSKGIWYFDGVTVRRATNRLQKFFDGQTWNGIAPISTATAALALHEAVSADNIYYLAYSDDGSALNNIMVIDLEGGTIARLPKSTVRCLGVDMTTQDVYYGTSAGFVHKLDNSTDDASAAVTFTIQTKYVDPERMASKGFGGIEIDIDTSGQSLTPTVYFNDGGSNAALTAISTSSRSKVYCPIPASTGSRKGRNISVRLSGSVSTINESSSPAVTLHGIKIYYEVLKQRGRVSV